jgi:biotin synthase
MDPEEIIERAVSAVKDRGFKLIVLQSGEDPFYTSEMLASIIREIKARSRVFIFISAGERGLGFYRTLREAGASGALLRFETSNPRLFRRLHPGGKAPAKDLDNRIRHLAFLKDLGYYIATGSLTGLPGQTLEDIAGDILLTKKWANMVSTGPFLPSPGTPLGASPRPASELYLKTIAATRLIMKKARIPVVTAFETLEGAGARKKAFSCGANSLMINLTPRPYRDLYALYPGKAFSDEEDDVFVRNGLFRFEGSFKMLEEKMLSEFGPSDEDS